VAVAGAATVRQLNHVAAASTVQRTTR